MTLLSFRFGGQGQDERPLRALTLQHRPFTLHKLAEVPAHVIIKRDSSNENLDTSTGNHLLIRYLFDELYLRSTLDRFPFSSLSRPARPEAPPLLRPCLVFTS